MCLLQQERLQLMKVIQYSCPEAAILTQPQHALRPALRLSLIGILLISSCYVAAFVLLSILLLGFCCFCDVNVPDDFYVF